MLADEEIDYYTRLVQHLKHAARFQFLAHVFGGQRIAGLAQKVLATRGKMGGDTFYTFLMRPDDLLKIAYIGHKSSRKDISNNTYQRMLQPRRLKKIAEYINEGGKFPTSIVVNLKTGKRSLRFEVKENLGDDALGTLHLPSSYASAWIIDGQHRLYGYAHARDGEGFNQDTTVLPVLAYENLPADQEMNLFIDINSKQVKVNTGLLIELYSDLHWHSSDAEEAFQALLSRITSRLNSESVSPFHDRMVVTGKRKTQFRCLTQTSIRDGLKAVDLLGTIRRGEISPGPLSTENARNYEANLDKSISVLVKCFRMFEEQLSEYWEAGDGPGGYICTNNGVRALLHVIKDIIDHIQSKDNRDYTLIDAEEVFASIEPYLQTLIDFLRICDQKKIQEIRTMGSSLSGFRQQSYALEAYIHEKLPGFQPQGLRKYLEDRDKDAAKKASDRVFEIQRILSNFVIEKLKEHYGTENKAWWIEGVSKETQKKCSVSWIDNNRKGSEQSYLNLIDYKKICEENWNLVKNVISLDAKNKDNKRENTKWIDDLNSIRNKTAHPEHGRLSAEQIVRVNDIYRKLHEALPKPDTQL